MSLKDTMKTAYRARYTAEHIAENSALTAYARENLDDERYAHLMRSRRNLLIFQLAPLAMLLLAVVLIFVFIPHEQFIPGVVTARETYLIFTATGFIFIYIMWLILSQFCVGRMWHRYVKWFRRCENLESAGGELRDLIDVCIRCGM